MSVLIIGDPHITHQTPRSRIKEDPYPLPTLRKILALHQKYPLDIPFVSLGDFTDMPVIKKEVENKVLVFFNKLCKKRKFYTIFGSHDIYNYDVSTYKKTSTFTLWESITNFHLLFPESYEKIEGLEYYVLPLRAPEEGQIHLPERQPDFILGHCFKTDLIEKPKVPTFLGHEHLTQPIDYPFHIPGSLTRMKVSENREFTKYYIINDDKSIEERKIKYDLNVFKETFDVSTSDTLDQNIQSLADALVKSIDNKESDRPSVILKKLKAPSNVCKYIGEKYRQLNYNF